MKLFLIAGLAVAVAGCAGQSPESQNLAADQQGAANVTEQAATDQAAIFRKKVVLGGLQDRSSEAQSDGDGDGNAADFSEQLNRLILARLAADESILLVERPQLMLLEDESSLAGQSLDVSGASVIVTGALTQLNHTSSEDSGLIKSSEKQSSNATVKLKLLDPSTGQVFVTVTGSGQSSLESKRVMGMGSSAKEDVTLDEQAVAAAVDAASTRLLQLLEEKPWTATVLRREGDLIYISAGTSQGLKPGMILPVAVREPGASAFSAVATVAQLRVAGMFGDSVADEGAVASVVAGSIEGFDSDQLVILKP